MTQWSDLPKEVQLEILKFVVSNILQDHTNRVPPGVYWGPYPDYIEESTDIDPENTLTRHDSGFDYDLEYDMYSMLGDGCDIQGNYEGSRLTSLLVVSRIFLVPDDLRNILLCCGHVSCPSPQHLSQFKNNFTLKKRKEFRIMWVKPQNIPLTDRILPIFGPNNTGLSLFRCLLYFPNLKLINVQLEQYVVLHINLRCDEDSGRLRYPTESQNALDYTSYTNSEGSGVDMEWLQDLLTTSTVLQGKLELRISFKAYEYDFPSWYEKRGSTLAVFSSKDFCVRVQYRDRQWVVKQPSDEWVQREKVLRHGKRSSFKELPGGIQALISAKARDRGRRLL